MGAPLANVVNTSANVASGPHSFGGDAPKQCLASAHKAPALLCNSRVALCSSARASAAAASCAACLLHSAWSTRPWVCVWVYWLAVRFSARSPVS